MRREDLAEQALALEEERQVLRRRFEEMETQRLALEGRAAAAAGEAASAVAEARSARQLQEECIQAKTALQQLTRKAKDVRMTSFAAL